MGDIAPVAVVTGASRGAGQGIATALAGRGWRVYGTGRTVADAPAWGTGVRVDHRDDDAVGALFERVGAEAGRLDLLVNNAAVISDDLVSPKPFWEKPRALADVLDVGLRSAYIASWHAAPLLTAQQRGLVVFTSSPGSVCYMHGPAYGAQKAGVDKMAADMAVDFRGTGVSAVSIWMGILLTDKLRSAFDGSPEALAAFAEQAETPEFTGHVIDALFRDPELDDVSGHTLIAAELATRYGITDEGGRTPPSHRQMLGAPREPSPVIIR
ncbi:MULTISPECIES: SDR family NAD(P)-dependent oxidoreductase [Mycolicibacterium]|uniref:Short-chain dehydrogenase/reductase SDR n=1 Tax=Mycolicibacterium vanbaalenii (strain DSM 7251 / JCM 13017 / BCRC 16820 / KCTC 9966 / NRRL B-24157 / PYR-1) TaxID=350058 RepID=A1TBZ6_MYCVP|nr:MULTISPECIES: SDR family NAD(P)-dependent oxidoreductase [Mycolicibacterium]ABM14696.1 short-chain dehydrogenase/reductase SDR [Mycolicibacterium vanbaalenii PYR-1]MCV7127306.1 SDR family NAD(P)-dependent oxidoreductase [Mycolicibacterium vanbaalenii PYR-1]MDW5612233.1 SDR family NAD(P)-dependent oxidoreductase [Mycolicibacterium sp. D5.8-2]UJL28151.1 SDR family NAD(P)-dependent oxidoreductase [Mycolicibacterium vanbaalenii]WND54839.1 SDR family NAD(P)-dependent oxidoreductase [Mycolicibact